MDGGISSLLSILNFLLVNSEEWNIELHIVDLCNKENILVEGF